MGSLDVIHSAVNATVPPARRGGNAETHVGLVVMGLDAYTTVTVITGQPVTL